MERFNAGDRVKVIRGTRRRLIQGQTYKVALVLARGSKDKHGALREGGLVLYSNQRGSYFPPVAWDFSRFEKVEARAS